MRSLIRLSATLPIAVASLALFALMVLTFCDVVLRSAFNAPIEAATELTRIAVAIIVFSALPALSAKGEHIAVDLLDPMFSGMGLARLRDGIVALVCGMMLWLPAERVVDLAWRAHSYGDQTEYLHIPDFYLSGFIALMSFASALALIVRGLLILFAPNAMGFFRHD